MSEIPYRILLKAARTFVKTALVARDKQCIAIIARAIMAERERCAKVCDDQKAIFLLESYSAGQPLSSFSERFACDEIKAAICKGASNDAD